MDAKDLRHAYAVLELTPPVDKTSLKHQHKILVRRWHPDQFQQDAVGQEEAAIRLRNINIAYEVVLASFEAQESSFVGEPFVGLPQDTTDRGFSLSSEQIDAIVDSMNRPDTTFSGGYSIQCWLSLGATFAYLVTAYILHARRDEMFMLFGYLLLPLMVIWMYGDGSGLAGVIIWILGWLLMALPAFVVLYSWLNA